MRKIQLGVAAFALVFIYNACKKSDNTTTGPSNARTIDNFSGTYNLTALSASIFGATINLYDSLPPCDQDNLIQLNTNLTAQFIDSGVKCSPLSDSSGTWSLSANTDTIYVAGGANVISAWDGKTLVLVGNQSVSGLSATVTTTLVKK